MKSKPGLRKIKKMFIHMLFLLHSMRKKQSKAELKLWKQDFCSLEDALSNKDHKKSSSIVCKLDHKVKRGLKKTFFYHAYDFILLCARGDHHGMVLPRGEDGAHKVCMYESSDLGNDLCNNVGIMGTFNHYRTKKN